MEYLGRLREGWGEVPLLLLPKLFTRSGGRRVVSLLADALHDELQESGLMAPTPVARVAELLSVKEMIVVCGSGGTGKTTIVAGLLGAEAAAVIGGRVLVLTVDPARRLATGARSRLGRVRQHRRACAAGRVHGRRAEVPRRAVGGHARHQGRVGRADPPPRP